MHGISGSEFCGSSGLARLIIEPLDLLVKAQLLGGFFKSLFLLATIGILLP